MANNIIDYLRQSREKLLLFGYFTLILVLSWPISQMLGNAWWNSHIVRSIFDLRLLFGVGLEPISVAIFGLFVGLLILMTIDPKKRIQAVLLWIGLAISLLGLQARGLFLPNVSFVASFPWLVGGIAAGLILGGGRDLFKVHTAQAFEFRRASQALFYLLAAFIVVGILELHVRYPDLLNVTSETVELQQIQSPTVGLNDDGLVRNLAFSGLFLVVVRRFVQYDAEKNFFILGPRASGKSLFLIGAYLEALDWSAQDDSDTPLRPTEDLMSMIEALDQNNSEWIVEATGRGELKELGFQYVHGSVFPTNVTLSGVDYAGEYLSRLPDAITGAVPEEDLDTTTQRLRDGVDEADTLMFVVDVERFVDNQPLEISEYFSILQATNGKDVMVIATKADHLAEEFEQEQGLEPHLYFEEFKQYVNTRLRESENVNSLITETSGAEIHPVYYQTTVDENGNRVPMRDSSGSVTTVGFDELLDEVGRRA